MSASRVFIEAQHRLKLTCPGCTDTSILDIEVKYGPTLVAAVAEYERRHAPCLDRVDQQAAARAAEEAAKKVAR